MDKIESSFFLFDRWFYLVKENDDFSRYSSVPNDPKAGLVIEKYKDTDYLEVFINKKNRLMAKILITGIFSTDIIFHYKELVPQITKINDDVYANIMIDAFSEIKYGSKMDADKVYFSKRNNLRRLCYREPKFLLDTTLCLEDFSISNPSFDYYKRLVSAFNLYVPNIKRDENEDIIEEIETDTVIDNLNIIEELYIDDRKYKFDRQEAGKIYFSNNQDGISNLMIKYDNINHFLEKLNISIKSKGSEKTNLVFDISRNEYKGINVTFYNVNEEDMYINYENVSNVKYVFNTSYDDNYNLLINSLELVLNGSTIKLSPHPVFTNTYVAENGDFYHIASKSFARLSGIAEFSNYIVPNIEKTLIK